MNIVYDGSFEGLLSAIKKALEFKNQHITISKDFKLDENMEIEKNDLDINFFDRDYLEKIKILFLSEIDGFEDVAFGVIKKESNSIRRFYEIKEKFFKVARRYKAFLRFKKIRDNFYLAVFEPEFNVIEYVGEYFKRKMNFDFIIYDVKREIAFMCYNKITKIEKIKIKIDLNDEIEKLWKRFHNAIAIENRRNENIQKQKIPLKYRKHITEFLS